MYVSSKFGPAFWGFYYLLLLVSFSVFKICPFSVNVNLKLEAELLKDNFQLKKFFHETCINLRKVIHELTQ